jgi:uncharacterized protein YbaR (Trm112 family)
MMDSKSYLDLVCPETKKKLIYCSLKEAEDLLGGNKLRPCRSGVPKPIGPTKRILLRDDLQCAYPIIDGIPVLLLPERLAAFEQMDNIDLKDTKYSEAFDEMEFYNEVAITGSKNIKQSIGYEIIEPILRASEDEIRSFPLPINIWIDMVHDCLSQWDAYTHLAPIQGKRILQIGGKGIHLIKFLLAGAKEGWLITPMIGEVIYCLELAKVAGVENRLHYVVGVGEELPFIAKFFDAIFSGGSMHHMTTHFALPECARVLNHGGKFSAIDPWQTPLHYIGTRICGQREFCAQHSEVPHRDSPLNKNRVMPFYQYFKNARINHHGILFRYILIGLEKLGMHFNLSTTWKIHKLEESLCKSFRKLNNRFGGSAALLGEM